MPAVAPSGALSLPLDALARMVAESAAFRAACGLAVDDALAAAKLYEGDNHARHIWLVEVETKRLQAHAPNCLIQWPATGALQFDEHSFGAHNDQEPSGQLRLILFDRDQRPGDLEASAIAFGNFCGGVLADLESISGASGWLSLRGMRTELGPLLPDDDELETAGGLFWMASWLFDWR